MSNNQLAVVNNMPEVAKEMTAGTLEKVLIGGDLAGLSPPERLQYYAAVCKSVGLNPLTKPFEYIALDGRLTLYALKGASDQIRNNKRITVEIVKRERVEDLLIVTARARTPDGRQDESIGVVPLTKEDGEWAEAKSGKRYFKTNGRWIPLKGADLANAFMKCETKAKRRVTLSIAGLGLLDETELDTVENAHFVTVDDEGRIENTDAIAEALRNAIDGCETLAELEAVGSKIGEAAKQGSIDAEQTKALRKLYSLHKKALQAAAEADVSAEPEAPAKIPDHLLDAYNLAREEFAQGPEALAEYMATLDEAVRAELEPHVARLEVQP